MPSTLVSYILSVYTMRVYCVFAMNIANYVGDASYSPKRRHVGAVEHREVSHSEFFSCFASCPVNQNQSMLIFCTRHKNMLDVMYSTDDSNQPRGAGPGIPTSSHVLQLQSPSMKIFPRNTGDPTLNVFLNVVLSSIAYATAAVGAAGASFVFPTTTVASHAKSHAFMFLRLRSVKINPYKVLRWRDCSFASRCVLLLSSAARQLMCSKPLLQKEYSTFIAITDRE